MSSTSSCASTPSTSSCASTPSSPAGPLTATPRQAPYSDGSSTSSCASTPPTSPPPLVVYPVSSSPPTLSLASRRPSAHSEPNHLGVSAISHQPFPRTPSPAPLHLSHAAFSNPPSPAPSHLSARSAASDLPPTPFYTPAQSPAPPEPATPLSLSALPPTYLLPTHLPTSLVSHHLSTLRAHQLPLAPPDKATLFLSTISTPRRAELEIRRLRLRIITTTTTRLSSANSREIRVVGLEWISASLAAGRLLDWKEYTILKRRVTTEACAKAREATREAARARYAADKSQHPRPILHHLTSSDLEQSHLPWWVKQRSRYSCLRTTPPHPHPTNQEFVKLITQIRDARRLHLDPIGTRAYSTALASLRAFPSPLTPQTLPLLPGCAQKLTTLFLEHQRTGTLAAVTALTHSPRHRILGELAGVYGVGPTIARRLYAKGVRAVEELLQDPYWGMLSRAQQVGVKYYDDFLAPVGRAEAEQIAGVVAEIVGGVMPGGEVVIAGGYRRGRESGHDVDLLVSSRGLKESEVKGVLYAILHALEAGGWVRYTLGIQGGGGGGEYRKGFDRLEKAFLVWEGAVRRRVDVVIVPAVAAGTGLLAWSGEGTFQRDLRLWCERKRGWKFSSEGVWAGRERVRGTEGWGVGETWVEAERRVLETIGVGWKEPGERCTG